MDPLTELIEERAILRLLNRYAHAMDYGDEEAWLDVFTPDAVFDTTESVGGKVVHRTVGRAELAEYVAHYPKPPRYCKHIVVDPLIELDERGDGARVEAYWLFLQREEPSGHPVITAFGHYRDRLVKADGVWRIAERYATVEATTA